MLILCSLGHILLLHTNKEEGEEFLLHSYPSTSIKQEYFNSLKGVFLACSGVSSTVLGENTKIFTFKSTYKRDADKDCGKIGNLNIQTKPTLDNNTYYKASFSQLSNMDILVVAILPMSYPDQVWVFAAEECK